jgi:hypothetical protein
VVNEALLKGIAVEPDGSYAYVGGYEDINDRGKAGDNKASAGGNYICSDA